jgi:hypothetical protein
MAAGLASPRAAARHLRAYGRASGSRTASLESGGGTDSESEDERAVCNSLLAKQPQQRGSSFVQPLGTPAAAVRARACAARRRARSPLRRSAAGEGRKAARRQGGRGGGAHARAVGAVGRTHAHAGGAAAARRVA